MQLFDGNAQWSGGCQVERMKLVEKKLEKFTFSNLLLLASRSRDIEPIHVYIVCCLEVLAPGANRFRLAWPKDMRTKKITSYCNFEKIGLGTKYRPAKLLGM